MFPTNNSCSLLQKETKTPDGPCQISEPFMTLENVRSDEHLGGKTSHPLQESHSYNAELQMLWGFWANYSSWPKQAGEEKSNLEM